MYLSFYITEMTNKKVLQICSSGRGFQRQGAGIFWRQGRAGVFLTPLQIIVLRLINSISIMGLHDVGMMHSHPLLRFSSSPGCMSHFAKTLVSLQTTAYISKSTKYFLHIVTTNLWIGPPCNYWVQHKFIIPSSCTNIHIHSFFP